VGNYLLAIVAFLLLLVPAMAQESASNIAPPSMHAGDWLSVNLRSKIQFDFGKVRPAPDVNENVLRGRRLRFGADGTLLRDLDYTFLTETAKGRPELRDIFLKYRKLGALQIQAGRFKIPFGLDRLTDSGDLDFVERSRIGTLLAPGRDTGAMVLGNVLERRLHYAAGVFRHDGTTSQLQDLTVTDKRFPGGGRTFAARVGITPLPSPLAPAAFRNLSVGAAFTRGSVPAGLSSLPGLTVSNQVFFPRMYASGVRERWGADLRWRLRLLLIQGELMSGHEQRLGQGIHGEDLPALRTQGWYVSAVHPLFGHIDTSGSRFLSSILPGMHLGLFEVTARYEMIGFSSEPSAGFAPSPSPRAANVIGNEDRVWTLGINWHANRYVKLQFNGVRETLRDPSRTPIEGVNRYRTLIGRAQLFF
jgi:phosphate-selective porin